MKTTLKRSCALTLLLSAGAVFSQANNAAAQTTDTPAPAPATVADAAPSKLEALIVTGTRTTGLRVEDSASPIQVLDAATISATGQPDLMQALGQTLPSLQVEAFGADTAALTLAARLRGLSANDTLVLINGKRRHGTANLTVDTGSPFIGSAAPDFSLIPAGAIQRIEVLTDGAAAQYGTDAIAGVVNIILKRDDHGGTISVEGGQYQDEGGRTGDVSGNFGFKPFDGAFANLTLESRYHGYSNRGAIDPRVVDPGNIASYPTMLSFPGYPYQNRIQGDASQRTQLASLNVGADLANDISVYGNATYAHKVGLSFENYRLPQASKTPLVYPSGFNPSEGISEDDFALSGGVKGTLAGWGWDLSTTYGKDVDKIGTYNTSNPDLFASLQTKFGTAAAIAGMPHNYQDGEFHSEQWTNTLDVNRDFAVGWATPLNVAVGLEQRTDKYEIVAGDATSRFGSGPSSFPGFTLTDAGSHTRRNEAIYLDLAGNPVKPWTVDAAVRSEHFTDFGNTTVGKLTNRYDFSPSVAIRGTISSGFRAPTQAEEYYSATNVGPSSAYVQLPPNSVGAKLVGIDGLKAEKSDNLSFGVILRPSEVSSVSLDLYQITIRDRIVGSGNVYNTDPASGQPAPAVTAAIAANGNVLDPAVVNGGQTGINIFSNAANTRTRGAEFVASLASNYGASGRVDWAAAATWNTTKVTNVNQVPSQLLPQKLLDLTALSQLETASPRFRLNLSGVWHVSDWTVGVTEAYYGESSDYEQGLTPDGNPGAYYKNTLKAQFITSTTISNQVTKSLVLTIGANNLFNQYPTKRNADLQASERAAVDNSAVAQYVNFSPYGFNGGFYYARATYSF